MHPTLTTLETGLRQLATAVLSSTSDERPASLIYSSGVYPGVDRHELSGMAIGLADRIKNIGGNELGENDAKLIEYKARIDFLVSNTVPNFFNGNGAQAIPAYIFTLKGLEHALRPVLMLDPARLAEDARLAKSATTKVRGLNTRIAELEPKVDVLQVMASEIVQAHAAADQLPTDLMTLREAREEIRSLREMALHDRDEASRLLAEMKRHEDSAKLRIAQSEQYQKKQVEAWTEASDTAKASASALITRCEDAMRTSTSFGLSGAFHDQAKSLKMSMLFWVFGLIVALSAGAFFGGEQLQQLSQAIEESTPPMIIWTRLLISLLSIGAPVWFGWLATKQIGQRFRLAEDYAYKASISRAYEGYRREAVELDPEFQVRLFSTALARLDEQPLRFVEHKTHGSPWHELLDSALFKQAIKVAPDLVGKFTEMAKEKIHAEKTEKKRNVGPEGDE